MLSIYLLLNFQNLGRAISKLSSEDEPTCIYDHLWCDNAHRECLESNIFLINTTIIYSTSKLLKLLLLEMFVYGTNRHSKQIPTLFLSEYKKWNHTGSAIQIFFSLYIQLGYQDSKFSMVSHFWILVSYQYYTIQISFHDSQCYNYRAA